MRGHHDRSEETLLTRLAASYIAREANRNALITPTRTILSPSRAKATIYVSVFPDTAVDSAISFLKRHQHNFFEYLKKESRLSPIPGIRFEFDFGEKNRQRLDEISRDI